MIYHTIRRDLYSGDFTMPYMHPCNLNVAIIADMAASGQFEFALEIFQTDTDFGGDEQQTRLVVYHGLLHFPGALDMLVGNSEGDDVYLIGSRLYLGSRMSGKIPAGTWELKVFPRNAVMNSSDFQTMKPVVDATILHLQPHKYYYVAVHGLCESIEYPASIAVMPEQEQPTTETRTELESKSSAEYQYHLSVLWALVLLVHVTALVF
jgi:hypothetical protein